METTPKPETEHFKLDTTPLRLRRGRSESVTLYEIVRKSPLTAVCHVCERSDLTYEQNMKRVEKLMLVLEAGYTALTEGK